MFIFYLFISEHISYLCKCKVQMYKSTQKDNVQK